MSEDHSTQPYTSDNAISSSINAEDTSKPSIKLKIKLKEPSPKQSTGKEGLKRKRSKKKSKASQDITNALPSEMALSTEDRNSEILMENDQGTTTEPLATNTQPKSRKKPKRKIVFDTGAPRKWNVSVVTFQTLTGANMSVPSWHTEEERKFEDKKVQKLESTSASLAASANDLHVPSSLPAGGLQSSLLQRADSVGDFGSVSVPPSSQLKAPTPGLPESSLKPSSSQIFNPDKPVACNFPGCEKHFADEPSMKKHYALAHTVREFMCRFPGCNQKFASKKILTHHQTQEHSKTPISSNK